MSGFDLNLHSGREMLLQMSFGKDGDFPGVLIRYQPEGELGKSLLGDNYLLIWGLIALEAVVEKTCGLLLVQILFDPLQASKRKRTRTYIND